MFSYIAALREDLNANAVSMVNPEAIERHARLIRRYEQTSTHHMNETVIKDAFDSDYRLQNLDLFHGYECDENELLYKFYFESEEIHEEYDASFALMTPSHLQAYAVTLYIAINYCEKDAILRDCYSTQRITHPEYVALPHRIHLASAGVYNALDFRGVVERKVEMLTNKRSKYLAKRVHDKLITKIYAPNSRIFEQARERFNELK